MGFAAVHPDLFPPPPVQSHRPSQAYSRNFAKIPPSARALQLEPCFVQSTRQETKCCILLPVLLFLIRNSSPATPQFLLLYIVSTNSSLLTSVIGGSQSISQFFAFNDSIVPKLDISLISKNEPPWFLSELRLSRRALHLSPLFSIQDSEFFTPSPQLFLLDIVSTNSSLLASVIGDSQSISQFLALNDSIALKLDFSPSPRTNGLGFCQK